MNKIKLSSEHIIVIRKFLIDNFNTRNGTDKDKLITNCPYCNDTKYHGILNLMWNNFYCFKCKTSKNLFKFLEDNDLLEEFYFVFQKELGISHYDMNKSISSLMIKEFKDKTSVKESSFNRFMKDYNLLHISEVKSAYEYALKRTNNDEEEVENYFVDENYIYIPIIINCEVAHLVGRKYHHIGKAPRYFNLSTKIINKYNFTKPSESFSFLDSVTSNPKTNILYLVEGYFDAYSVNKAMGDYVAVSLLGKNLSENGLKILKLNFSPFTQIRILLDSIEKDKGNVESIIKITSRIQKVYPDTKIVMLPNSDPNDIHTSKGEDYLRKLIKTQTNNSLSLAEFELLNSRSLLLKGNSNDNVRNFIERWE